eukprot:1136129-Pelagomonas_calceolata.AAC.2
MLRFNAHNACSQLCPFTTVMALISMMLVNNCSKGFRKIVPSKRGAGSQWGGAIVFITHQCAAEVRRRPVMSTLAQ